MFDQRKVANNTIDCRLPIDSSIRGYRILLSAFDNFTLIGSTRAYFSPEIFGTDPERSGSGVRLHFSDTDLSIREKPDPVCMVWCI